MNPAPALLALLLASSAVGPVPNATQAQEPPTVDRPVRQIPIDESRTHKVYRVRTAPGLQAILEFPEGFSSPPSCGDCADGGAPASTLQTSPALFVIQTFASENYIAIKPLRFSREDGGDGPPAEEFLTTVTVRLVSKLTITLQVEYAPRDKADARLVFTFPHRSAETEYVRQQVARARAELEASYASRISAATTRVLLLTLLEAPKCTSVSRFVRTGDTRLDVTQMCRVGDKLFVRFTVENRGRTPLALGTVRLERMDGGVSIPIEDAQFRLSQDELEFRDVTKGVIGYELPEGQPAAMSYSLHLQEKSGDGREVVVRGFGF
jgi:hypothetical protein